jgi:neutral ceramidase
LACISAGLDRARFTVRPTAPRERAFVPGLLAGAEDVDVTPPPGLPKAGYSRNARTGAGFRSRIRARVLHLRAGRSSVAVVACDLLGGSAVVQHLVAETIAARTDVPLAGLLIGATHTHGGPGQFLGTDFYNRFASNLPGFDPAWTAFLVEQISAGVIRAVENRRPAVAAYGRAEVWGLTRNRSLAAHVRNSAAKAGGRRDTRIEPQRAYAGVNPALDLIRVDAVAGEGGCEPLAALATFSVHGTGIPHASSLYNADLWAYVVTETADRIERTCGRRPVVAALQGTHGDVAPAIRPGRAGYVEAARVGREIGARAAELHHRLEGRLAADFPLGCGLREVDLTARPSVRGITLPRHPAVGAALVAGAFENETPVVAAIPPFRAGHPKRWRARGPQGAKWVVGGRRGQSLLLPLRGFPRVLPIQILMIGPATLVGLPCEITAESGRRIAAAVAAELPVGGSPLEDAAAGDHSIIHSVIVTSVANEYSGYCTTPEEYSRQNYEGGHTLYGPLTQPFLAGCAADLAADVMLRGTVSDVIAERRFDLAIRRYLPSRGGGPCARRIAGPARFTDMTPDADACWELSWEDVAPGDLEWHRRLVRVDVSTPDGGWEQVRRAQAPVDDRRPDLEVVHLGEFAGRRHRYAARWWNPAFRGGRPHRFVLTSNGGQPEAASEPFD